MTSFADITTMGVGGPIAHFIEPTTRVGLIEAVEEADSKGLPLVVVGGGSNLLVSDRPFDGVVVRDARRLITVPDEAAPVEGEDRTAMVMPRGLNAEASVPRGRDDFVHGLSPLELGRLRCPARRSSSGTVRHSRHSRRFRGGMPDRNAVRRNR